MITRMKARVTIKCDNCGCRFGIGNANGIPNGMSFVQKDNRSITLCQKCIMAIGEMSDSEKAEFSAILRAKMDGKDGDKS